jgi:hypothetical protein
MKKLGVIAAATLGLLVILAIGSYAVAGSGKSQVTTGDMIGYLEPPSISTTASGSFEATIDDANQEINWTLSYANPEGTVTQAHIHFGQRSVNGGISVFLCSNLGNGPAGTQPCPPAPATISGTIRPADVSPPIPATAAARAQGIDTGEFAELVNAIRAGRTYANVHSTKFPGGEVRGQINDDDQRDS